MERHRWKCVYSLLEIAATYICSIFDYENENKFTWPVLFYIFLPLAFILVQTENNLSAVLLWTMDIKSILKVYCLCQWISDQIWSILHRKFKDHVIWCRFILFILRWTYHYVSLWVKDAESWARKGNIPIWSNTLPFHTIFIFIIIFFLLIHQHLLIMDFTDKMTWSFYCFFFANRAGSAERKKTIEH